MALINCPECNKKISNSAKNCPNCGYKLKKNKNSKNRAIIKDFFIIAGMLDVVTFVTIHRNIYILIVSIATIFAVYIFLVSILDYLKE